MSETKVIEQEFNDKPIFAVFVVDEDGNQKEGTKPLVSMGIKKAQALVVHLKELEAFVLENS